MPSDSLSSTIQKMLCRLEMWRRRLMACWWCRNVYRVYSSVKVVCAHDIYDWFDLLSSGSVEQYVGFAKTWNIVNELSTFSVSVSHLSNGYAAAALNQMMFAKSKHVTMRSATEKFLIFGILCFVYYLLPNNWLIQFIVASPIVDWLDRCAVDCRRRRRRDRGRCCYHHQALSLIRPSRLNQLTFDVSFYFWTADVHTHNNAFMPYAHIRCDTVAFECSTEQIRMIR